MNTTQLMATWKRGRPMLTAASLRYGQHHSSIIGARTLWMAMLILADGEITEAQPFSQVIGLSKVQASGILKLLAKERLLEPLPPRPSTSHAHGGGRPIKRYRATGRLLEALGLNTPKEAA